jgi:hypothetical protein
MIETGLLLAALVGIGMFAWSIVDIMRIETSASGVGIPPLAWPGIGLFVGSLLLLQFVRAMLQRHRRDDGSPRADARGAAAAATATLLALEEDAAAQAAAAKTPTDRT